MQADQKPQRVISGSKGLQRARLAIQAGDIVAFSTETVYGLGADATNNQAVAKIFKTKGRPRFNPLIVHVLNENDAKNLVSWNTAANKLSRAFWPGPLTLVLPRLPGCKVSFLANAGLDTLAIRVPSHNLARKLLSSTDCPIAAPSANKFGRMSPTTALHVDEEFGPELTLILDGGPCALGLESTVVDLTTKRPVLLRPGSITNEEIGTVIGPIATATQHSKIKSPGMLDRHYAPKASLRLNVNAPVDGEVLVGFGPLAPDGAVNLSPAGDLLEAATNFFSTLRELDSAGNKKLAIMPIPTSGLGFAINDRLKRAASDA
ncbi:MAG TPA: threonylcarbamoyl-AMP synthase [Rhodospirillales bacterium]|nr:threonylcarbamoyl-AMP synthase [Rhodospirillales bacterium]